MHSFENVASSDRKKKNWDLLWKIFMRKGIPVDRAHVDAVMAAKSNDAPVELLTILYGFIHSNDFEFTAAPSVKVDPERLLELSAPVVRDRGHDASTSDGEGDNEGQQQQQLYDNQQSHQIQHQQGQHQQGQHQQQQQRRADDAYRQQQAQQQKQQQQAQQQQQQQQQQAQHRYATTYDDPNGIHFSNAYTAAPACGVGGPQQQQQQEYGRGGCSGSGGGGAPLQLPDIREPRRRAGAASVASSGQRRRQSGPGGGGGGGGSVRSGHPGRGGSRERHDAPAVAPVAQQQAGWTVQPGGGQYGSGGMGLMQSMQQQYYAQMQAQQQQAAQQAAQLYQAQQQYQAQQYQAAYGGMGYGSVPAYPGTMMSIYPTSYMQPGTAMRAGQAPPQAPPPPPPAYQQHQQQHQPKQQQQQQQQRSSLPNVAPHGGSPQYSLPTGPKGPASVQRGGPRGGGSPGGMSTQSVRFSPPELMPAQPPPPPPRATSMQPPGAASVYTPQPPPPPMRGGGSGPGSYASGYSVRAAQSSGGSYACSSRAASGEPVRLAPLQQQPAVAGAAAQQQQQQQQLQLTPLTGPRSAQLVADVRQLEAELEALQQEADAEASAGSGLGGLTAAASQSQAPRAHAAAAAAGSSSGVGSGLSAESSVLNPATNPKRTAAMSAYQAASAASAAAAAKAKAASEQFELEYVVLMQRPQREASLDELASVVPPDDFQPFDGTKSHAQGTAAAATALPPAVDKAARAAQVVAQMKAQALAEAAAAVADAAASVAATPPWDALRRTTDAVPSTAGVYGASSSPPAARQSLPPASSRAPPTRIPQSPLQGASRAVVPQAPLPAAGRGHHELPHQMNQQDEAKVLEIKAELARLMA
ncbi:hypothetical protein FOA52_003534 [Chlamydomonas sp. UWO 241]|nr:hypothetical protein FOA52_003534 [Chlamydomonas sp. UWO 241]